MQNHSNNISRRAISAALVIGAGASASGCFGSFGLSKMVYDWNDSFGSKWVKWLVFLGLNIIPIYSITLFVDALVLNSIEFWFGKHPVASNTLPEGRRVVTARTDDPDVLRHELYEGERRVAVLMMRREGEHGVTLMNERGEVLTRVALDAQTLTLFDARGEAVVRLDQEDCRTVAGKTQRGERVTTALFDQVANTGQATNLSEASARLPSHLG